MRPPNPIHPGRMLLEEFLAPSGLSQRAFAKRLGWTVAKRLSQNLMSQRRHYFGPASRSDDESYSQGYGEEERRRGRPKRVSPSVARKRPVCGVVGPQRMPCGYASALRLASRPFPGHHWLIRF